MPVRKKIKICLGGVQVQVPSLSDPSPSPSSRLPRLLPSNLLPSNLLIGNLLDGNLLISKKPDRTQVTHG